MEPINDRVVLKEWKGEESTTVGGIVVPDFARRGTHAEVVAVGPGNRAIASGGRMELSVKSGDVVLVSPKSGIPIMVDGNNFTVVREDEILVNLGRKGDVS